MPEDDIDDDNVDPWTTKVWPRGTQGYERVIFFSDAVFAIALTLIAVQIAIPTITNVNDNSQVWGAITGLAGNIFAFAFSFFWVGFYWKANHRFTTTLQAMSNRYVIALLVYLFIVALLPFPTGIIGEYWNPVGLAVFWGYLGCLSFMETVLIVVAFADHLFVKELNKAQRKRYMFTSLSPVIGALCAMPMAFVNMYASIATMFVIASGLSFLVRRHYPEVM